MPRRHLLHLAQGALTRRQVIVIGRGRRGRRVVAIAHDGGIEFRCPAQRQGIGGLVDGDPVLGARTVADDDRRIGVCPLLTGDIVLHQRHALDVTARRMRDEIGPVGLARSARRGFDNLEIDRVVGVGADHPAIAPVVGVIQPSGQARLQNDRRGGRGRSRDGPGLGRFLVGDRDQDKGVVSGAANAHEQSVVLLLIDQGRLAATRRATENPVRPSVVVTVGPEDPLAVGREGEAAVGRADRVGQDLAGREIPDENLVHFGPLRIFRIGEECVVGAVLRRRDL